ncbi:MAG: hypothetical protein L6R37_004119 [Teloschistes peruensis]|nr:MAG: hypothetical protein L6R37_004119 [Teloschistes peruensis]
MRPHLTNTCLQQCSSQTLVLPLHTLPLPPTILTQINTLTSSLFLAATAHPTTFQPLPNAFEVYGLDFLVSPSSPSSSTTDSKVYLLEVNAFPDFAQSGGLGGEKGEGAEEGGEKGGKEVIAGLWRAVIAIAVKGFFSSGTKTKTGNGEEEEEEDEEKWGMKKVLDVDLGRR